MGNKRIKQKIVCIALVLVLLVCTACGKGGETVQEEAPPLQSTFTFTDDLGRELTLLAPQRVCAMIGSFAEIWVLAGGTDSLVAAADDTWTSFSLGLPESVVNIGTVKDPDLERVIAAQPELVLASCNTQSNLDLRTSFESLKIPVAFFDIQNVDDYLRMLKICTELTGHPECYDTYGVQVKEQCDRAIARQDGSMPTVLCMRATGSSCKVKGSEGFLLGEMLRDLGCVNIADSDGSLLETLSLEAILQKDPDFIFVVMQGSDPTEAEKTLEQTLLANPAWQQLTAVKEGRFHTLEHRLFNLKPNAQWGTAYEKLADILYGT